MPANVQLVSYVGSSFPVSSLKLLRGMNFVNERLCFKVDYKKLINYAYSNFMNGVELTCDSNINATVTGWSIV